MIDKNCPNSPVKNKTLEKEHFKIYKQTREDQFFLTEDLIQLLKPAIQMLLYPKN